MYMSLRNYVMNGQQTPKDAATPNRFFTLPREVRDMIYRETLCSTYMICWPKRWKRGKAVFHDDRLLFWFRHRQIVWRGCFWSGRVWTKKRPLFWADIALLLTSKAISHEGMEIMYNQSLFSLYRGLRSECVYNVTPLPSQQVLERIQNLEMAICVCDILNESATETWLTFSGSDTKRNTCRIFISCYDCLDDFRDPIFEACQSLIGFKVVTLTLDLVWMDAGLNHDLLETFQVALEPHLGHSRSYEIDSVLALEFHPRKHLEDGQAALPKSKPQLLVS